MAFDPQKFALDQLKLVQPKAGSFDPKKFALSLGIKSKADLTTAQGLADYATSQGLGEEVSKIMKPPKLSVLQRLSKGLSALNPAQAISVGKEKGLAAGLLEYPKSIVSGVGSALTGKDYEPNRKMFGDIAADMGVENGIAKFGIGFLGDVLLDPSTYFGGVIAKKIAQAAGVVGKTALSGVSKVSPSVGEGLTTAVSGLQDAFGAAFKLGYKETEGAKDYIFSHINKVARELTKRAGLQLNWLGVKGMTDIMGEEVALKSAIGRQAEWELGEQLAQKSLTPQMKRLSEVSTEMDILEQTISQDPAKKLAKYANAGGELPEITGKKLSSKYGKTGDQIADELGFKNSEDAQKAYTAYRTSRLKLNSLKEEYRTLGGKKELLNVKKIGRPAVSAMIKKARETGDWSELEAINKELAEKANVKFDNPIQQEYLEKQRKIFEANVKLGNIEDPWSNYFPFIKKIAKDKFINNMKRLGIRVGSEEWNKEFKNLLKIENIELDPRIASFTREGQILTDIKNREALNEFVQKFGKPLNAFTDEATAKASGYRLLKENGGFGKAVGYVGEWDKKLFDDLIRFDFQPLSMIAKATGFDSLTSLFKRGVTGLFVPFHVRNWVSGDIQNFEVVGYKALLPFFKANGIKLAKRIGEDKIPEGSIKLAGKNVSWKEIFEPFANRFSGDTFWNADFTEEINYGRKLKFGAKIFTKERAKETLKTAGLGTEALPFKVGRVVGQFIEHQQKATAYLVALDQGKTIQQALKLAEMAGFDYRALTSFESQIMKRLIPFYSFTRKNIELQLKTLGENPQRINQILATFRNVGQQIPEDEKEALPMYIRESLGIKLEDAPNGLKQYLSGFGTPVEQFTQLFGTNPILRAISTMNPMLKVPLEIGMGKDSFRQKDLKEVYDAKEYKLMPQVVKDLIDLKEVQKDILEKNAMGKLIKVGEKTQYVADPVKLLVARSLFTARGVSYFDQVLGGDLQGFAKYLKTTTGFKPQQIDLDVYKSIKENTDKRALEDLLSRYGDVRKLQKVYIPKNK